MVQVFQKAICSPFFFFWKVSPYTFPGKLLNIMKCRGIGKIEALVEFGFVQTIGFFHLAG